MGYVFLLLAELYVLNMLSAVFTARLFGLIRYLVKSERTSIIIFSFLFLPGTFVHELSHFLSALALLVPVGEMSLVPSVSEAGQIKMGGVAIAKTDPVRRFLVGVSPVLLGTFFISVIAYLWTGGILTTNIWGDLIIYYVFFEVGNTMFASKKDMEGALELFIFLLIFLTVFWLTGVKSFVPTQLDTDFYLQKFYEVIEFCAIFLLIPIVIDTTLLAATYLIERRLGIKLRKH